jgi:undecaprenyl phosphate-alpha-L-ara4N flippase subunit ArnE
MSLIYALILGGSVCASVGQMLFKAGASNRHTLQDFLNGWIVWGLFFYAVGTLLWIYSLSKAPLTIVYPFTALTFVLVYLGGVLIYDEPTTPTALGGVALVLVGLYFIAVK